VDWLLKMHAICKIYKNFWKKLPKSFTSPWSPVSTTVGADDSAEDCRARSVIEDFLGGNLIFQPLGIVNGPIRI